MYAFSHKTLEAIVLKFNKNSFGEAKHKTLKYSTLTFSVKLKSSNVLALLMYVNLS